MANEKSVDADKESFFTLDNCLLDKYGDSGKNNIIFTDCTAASAYGVYYHQVQTGAYRGIGLAEEINAGDR